METFTTKKIDLTFLESRANVGKPVHADDLSGGNKLTATMYEITGVDGTKRTLSMAGLVMVLCLSRATELERGIIEIMSQMERTSDQLERLTRIEEDLAAGHSVSSTGELTSADIDRLRDLGYNPINYDSVGELYDAIYKDWKYQVYGDPNYAELNNWLNRLSVYDRAMDVTDLMSDEVFLNYMGISPQDVSTIESKMDSLNSFSQSTMIELQSQTTKRDQAYDMVANVIKSMMGVLTGIANNL